MPLEYELRRSGLRSGNFENHLRVRLLRYAVLVLSPIYWSCLEKLRSGRLGLAPLVEAFEVPVNHYGFNQAKNQLFHSITTKLGACKWP